MLWLCLLIILSAIVWLRPAGVPLSVSVSVLGYTNLVGPHALIAITNRSDRAITLESTGWVCLSGNPSRAPGDITSIYPNNFRVTELGPQEGFVQEFFVFPAGRESAWKFQCNAAYSSALLEARRSAENWLRKHKLSSKYRLLTSRAWHTCNTEWSACPP